MKSIVINLLASWSGSIESFQDGDVFRESNIDLSMGSVANRLGFLKNAVDNAVSLANPNTFSAKQTFSSGIVTTEVELSVNRVVTHIYRPSRADGTWTVSAAGVYTASGVGGTSNIVMREIPDLPHGVTITGCKVTIEPAATHGAMPATKPTLRLRRYASDSSFTDVGSLADPLTSTTPYETVHEISITGLTHVVDRSKAYELQVVNEGSTNSQSGLKVHSFELTYELEKL